MLEKHLFPEHPMLPQQDFIIFSFVRHLFYLLYYVLILGCTFFSLSLWTCVEVRGQFFPPLCGFQGSESSGLAANAFTNWATSPAWIALWHTETEMDVSMSLIQLGILLFYNKDTNSEVTCVRIQTCVSGHSCCVVIVGIVWKREETYNWRGSGLDVPYLKSVCTHTQN